MFDEVPKNCQYGYARVSSKSQEENSSLESQKKDFLDRGVPEKNIRIEIGSAADKPVFYHLIDEDDYSYHYRYHYTY
jgi:DNA invertase Pin-like site-specific DNA recombinase